MYKSTKKVVIASAAIATVFFGHSALAAPGQTSGSGGSNGNYYWAHGNSSAGMGIYASGSTNYIHNRKYSNSSSTYAEMWGYTGVQANGYFLKNSRRVLDVQNYTNPKRHSPTNWSHYQTSSIKVNGSTVFEDTKNGSKKTDTDLSHSYNLPSYTFFNASATYPIGPVVVTVSGSLRGEAGASVTQANNTRDWSSLYYDHFTSEIKPEVALVASGSASVYGGFVKGMANVDIIRADNRTWSDLIRTRYKNNNNSNGVRYQGVTFNNSSLSTGGGDLEIEVLWGAYDKTIARWDGYDISSSQYWARNHDQYFAYTTE